jgi:hypothetical protein
MILFWKCARFLPQTSTSALYQHVIFPVELLNKRVRIFSPTSVPPGSRVKITLTPFGFQVVTNKGNFVCFFLHPQPHQ